MTEAKHTATQKKLQSNERQTPLEPKDVNGRPLPPYRPGWLADELDREDREMERIRRQRGGHYPWPMGNNHTCIIADMEKIWYFPGYDHSLIHAIQDLHGVLERLSQDVPKSFPGDKRLSTSVKLTESALSLLASMLPADSASRKQFCGKGHAC